MNRTSVLVTAGATLLLAFAAPAAASAHVTVAPNTTHAGSWALVNVKVPNESATAVTNKIQLSLPTDTPILNVSYVPVAGWTTELVREDLPTPVEMGGNTITEAVTTVTWTASAGAEISAGQLQVFPLSLGPIPDTGKIILIAEQTYSDGNVVSWSDLAEGAEHPAPVIYVNDTPAKDHHSNVGDQEGTDMNDTAHENSVGNDGSVAASTGPDTIARGLGLGGLVVGAISITIAIAALRRKAA